MGAALLSRPRSRPRLRPPPSSSLPPPLSSFALPLFPLPPVLPSFSTCRKRPSHLPPPPCPPISVISAAATLSVAHPGVIKVALKILLRGHVRLAASLQVPCRSRGRCKGFERGCWSPFVDGDVFFLLIFCCIHAIVFVILAIVLFLLIPLTFIIVDSFRYKKYLFPIYLYFLGFSFGFLIGVQLFISINGLYFYFFAGKESQRRLTMSYL